METKKESLEEEIKKIRVQYIENPTMTTKQYHSKVEEIRTKYDKKGENYSKRMD